MTLAFQAEEIKNRKNKSKCLDKSKFNEERIENYNFWALDKTHLGIPGQLSSGQPLVGGVASSLQKDT